MIKNELSKLFLETIPPAMHLLRKHVRQSSTPCLSVPQFRVLINIEHGLTHICEIADHHGISQPGMSKLVEGLVGRDFISKHPSPNDKRVIELKLTKKGKTTLSKIKQKAVDNLNIDFSILNKKEISELIKALETLNTLVKNLKENNIK